MQNESFRIAIVGGIAVGKSTILNSLSENLDNCLSIEEDVSQNIFLPNFYEDMKKWAFHSRISTMAMIANNYLNICNHPEAEIVLMDRCLDELITFAQLHYDKGNMSDKEFAVYKMLYNSLLEFAPAIDLFLYVNCSPENSMERIKKRNRSFEQDITIEYIKKLNSYYDRWITSLNPQKVISLNTDSIISSSEIATLIKNAISRK